LVYADDVANDFGYERGERMLLEMGTFFSYGYNASGAIGGPGFAGRGMGEDRYDLLNPGNRVHAAIKATSVRSSSEFILITDAAADGWADFSVLPMPSRSQLGNPFKAQPGLDDSVSDIHRGGSNVLFADGHVQWYLRNDVFVKWLPVPEEARKQRYWNSDNLPSRPW
jgi:prepilin-type processing-associated H-X9-DG protein